MSANGLTHPEIIARISSLLEYHGYPRSGAKTRHGYPRRGAKAKIAEVCGISVSAVHQWFNTTKNIKHEHLASLASAFGTTLDWIITGNGDMCSSEPVARISIQQSPAPHHQGNLAAKALVENAKVEILGLAKELESTDVQTAYKLMKLAIRVDEIKDVL